MMIPQRRRFKDLDEQHILALAISSEEDDARIYRGFGRCLGLCRRRVDRQRLISIDPHGPSAKAG